MLTGWIGVDLDGSLVKDRFPDIGPLIPAMAARVRAWLAEGREVRIVTARVAWHRDDDPNDRYDYQHFKFAVEQRQLIEAWTQATFGRRLRVTSQKDRDMVELWDDRAVQLVKDTGCRVDGCE